MRYRGLYLLLFLFIAGCGGREALKPNGTPGPGTIPGVMGPNVPILSDLKSPVLDADYQAALASVGDSEPGPRNASAFLTIGQYQYNQGRLDEALKTYQKLLLGADNFQGQDKAQYMVGQIYFDKGDHLAALAAFQKVAPRNGQETYSNQARQMMDFILAYSLGIDDLKKYIQNYPDSPVRCSAQFQLASREAQAGIQGEAIDHLNRFLQQCPQHPSAPSAQLLLQTLQGHQDDSWRVGVLIPKTGKFQPFGDSVMNGIALAVEEANQNGGTKKHMSLVVKDTGSDGTMAVTQFRALVQDDGLDAVIGPVAPGDIQAVGALADERRVTMICPAASRDGLSSLGPYIFSDSMTNEMQGRVIARFAVEKLGLKKFAILAPQDVYGKTLSDQFQRTVQAMGATILDSEVYVPGSTDFKKQLITLGGQDPNINKENDRENVRRWSELRYSLGKEAEKILLKVKDMRDSSSVKPADPPIVGFVPMAEGLGNTLCPSIAQDVNAGVREAFQGKDAFTFRTDDIVKQSLQRLPVELTGTTLTATADQWAEVAHDMQANIILTGHIVEPTPEKDWTTYPNWDYNIHFEAFWMDPKRNQMVRFYQSKIPFSPFKPVSLVRAADTYQALYLPAHSAEVPLLTSQIHFYDLNPVFLGGHLWDNDAILREGAKDMEGAYYVTGFYVDSQQSAAKHFVEGYVKKFAKRPDLYAAQAYDAMRLLIQAANQSANRDDIHTNLMQIRGFDGACGSIDYAGKNEPDKLVPVIKIQDGKRQQVQ
ncbi:MAG TPA: penicillin-binding protein activator [bacterium]|nr:penicillin-binding protein activator [bacterium]